MLKKKSENVRLRYCDGKDKYLHTTGVKDVEKYPLITSAQWSQITELSYRCATTASLKVTYVV
jgi:hypothetical protein